MLRRVLPSSSLDRLRIPSQRKMMKIPGVSMLRKLLASAVVSAGLLLVVVSVPMIVRAQAPPPLTVTHRDQGTFSKTLSKPYDPATDPSGMYTFLKEGEFVQLTVEDGKLSGFISRFGDTSSDKGEFIDQFFDKALLEGSHLSFKTKTVHAVWYDFDGILSVEPGKKVGDEGYRVIRGKLTLHASDAKGNGQASEKTVELKSFPDLRHPNN
jgi:hypothetical protein